jgi:hypothetical protein
MSLSRFYPATYARTHKFFGSFFQKRTASFLVCDQAAIHGQSHAEHEGGIHETLLAA